MSYITLALEEMKQKLWISAVLPGFPQADSERDLAQDQAAADSQALRQGNQARSRQPRYHSTVRRSPSGTLTSGR